MLIKRLFALCFLFGYIFSYAAEPTLVLDRKYWFHSLSTIDGLSNNNVTCLLEDNKGRIWIGTESGANIYDGYTVRQLSLGKEINTSASDVVTSIQQDALGNVWVNYNGGDPTAGSPTVTLLRLHPSHESQSGKRPPEG